jgi:hypothetical protein
MAHFSRHHVANDEGRIPMTRKFRFAYLASALVLAAVTVQGTFAAEEQFAVTSIIQLPDDQSLGSFDIGLVDPVRGIYILADRTHKSIDVVDTRTNIVINQLRPGFVGFTGDNNTSGPNGVLIVNHSQVWAGDGDSTVKVILLGPETGQLIATISTGGTARADELCYDPNDHVILVANDADIPPFVTFISSTSHAILGKIKMDGNDGTPQATNGIEQCQWSPQTGKFYLNIPQVDGTPGANDTPGVVLQIDPISEEINNTFSLASTNCRGNMGMAIGPDPQILLGCSNSGTDSVIIDERTGDILLPPLSGESGADEVWYNPGDNHYFLANGSHITGATHSPQLGVVDPSASEGTHEDPSATSAQGSHSVAADPLKNQVYVPVNNKTSGPSPGALSGICGAHGGDDSKGCIAVFTKTNELSPKRSSLLMHNTGRAPRCRQIKASRLLATGTGV